MCGPTLLERDKKKKQSPVAVSLPRDQTDVEGFFLSSHAERSHHPQSGLCISSSKWDSVLDVQTSFLPLWETKAEVCSPC